MTYEKDLDDLKKNFIQFANSIPFYGNISLGIDSIHIQNILSLFFCC